MNIKRLLIIMLLLSPAALAQAPIDAATLATSQEIIEDYKNLRRACTITLEEQRRICFRQLASSSEEYIAAKKIVSRYQEEKQTLAVELGL
jgi:hypothetical protein